MNHRYLVLALMILTVLLASLLSSCGSTKDTISNGLPQVAFPEDEGAHPDSLVEWWYLNANLHDAQGKEYTAMVAYFTPTMRIMSISDLENGAFYQDAPEFSDLLSATNNYAEGVLNKFSKKLMGG